MTALPSPPGPLPVVVAGRGLDAVPRTAVRLARGQYLLPTAPPPVWHQQYEVSLARILAVHRTHPSPSAFTHSSAALLHGALVRDHEPDVHVTQPCAARRSTLPLPRVVYGAPLVWGRQGAPPPRGHRLQRGASCHLRRHRRRLPDDEVTAVAGLPVTTVPRTIADCLLGLPPRDAVVSADSLLRGAVLPDRFAPGPERARTTEVLAQVGEQLRRAGPRQHVRRARALLPLLSPWAESPGESELRYLLLRAGLPEPAAQVGVRVGGNLYFPDLAWPDLRLGVEFDGRGKYVEPGAYYREKRRGDEIEEAGWRLTRVSFEDLQDVQALVGRILRKVPPGMPFPVRPRQVIA